MSTNPTKEERKCIVCCELFFAWASRSKAVCSDKCKYLLRNGRSSISVKRCIVCEKEFETLHYGHKTCSEECEALWRKSTPSYLRQLIIQRVEPKEAIQCEYCGKLFIPRRNGQRCCNDKHGRYLASRIRRSYKFGSALGHYSREEIFARDNYICHICGRPLNMAVTVPSLDAPTIDHVVPLAKGGTDELNNVKAAHFYCNSLKQDKLLGQCSRGPRVGNYGVDTFTLYSWACAHQWHQHSIACVSRPHRRRYSFIKVLLPATSYYLPAFPSFTGQGCGGTPPTRCLSLSAQAISLLTPHPFREGVGG